MNINRISATKFNKVQNKQNNNSNPFINTAPKADTVSFSGKKNFKKRLAYTLGTMFLTIASAFSAIIPKTTAKADVITSQYNDRADDAPLNKAKTRIIDDYSQYEPTMNELWENNEFQLDQTLDSQSITFDFSEN